MAARAGVFGTVALTQLLLGSPARADGLNLSWSDCGAAGTEFRVFACDTNSGQSVLVGSVVPPAGFNQIANASIALELQFTQPGIPNWWQFRNAGSCRVSSVSVSFGDSGVTNCQDHWKGQAVGGFGSYSQVISPHSWRLTIAVAVPLENIEDWPEGVEVFLFRILIDHNQTVGNDSCGGCDRGANIIFDWLSVGTHPPSGGRIVDWPAERNAVRWNGGVTPTLKTTWSAIKSLYR